MSIGALSVTSATLNLTAPDGQGRFTAPESPTGDVFWGWWEQPPGPAGQAYATPVMLTKAADGIWQGEIVPLPQTFHLFLKFATNDEGNWTGAFRNPEYNMNGGSSRFFAELNGDALLFQTPDGQITKNATLMSGPEKIQLEWPPVPVPLELKRATDSQLGAFLPRAAGTYAYRAPDPTDSDWETARAAEAGFDEAALTRLVQALIDADPAGRRPQLIHSLLVARKGKLVLEEYFFGTDRNTPHDIRSAGKTFASVLLGAVIQAGGQLSPDTKVFDLLKSRGPFQNPDARKASITLANLLTHTSGLDCNDNDNASPGNEGAMSGQSEQPDWWLFTLSLPVSHDPGSRYAYCSAGINLVGAALNEATGKSVQDLFETLVARPLKFGRYHWNLMPNGQGYLGGGAYLRPIDLLKLGQLYLNGGVWHGQRIVSEDWAKTSTAAHVEINEATTGMDAEAFANFMTPGADGLGWHRYGVSAVGQRVESYEASGNGGQYMIVVPSLDLVVVMTGGNYGQGAIWTKWRDEIVGAQIIPALTGASSLQ